MRLDVYVAHKTHIEFTEVKSYRCWRFIYGIYLKFLGADGEFR